MRTRTMLLSFIALGIGQEGTWFSNFGAQCVMIRHLVCWLHSILLCISESVVVNIEESTYSSARIRPVNSPLGLYSSNLSTSLTRHGVEHYLILDAKKQIVNRARDAQEQLTVGTRELLRHISQCTRTTDWLTTMIDRHGNSADWNN